MCVCDCVHVITYSKSRHWAAQLWHRTSSFHSAQSRGLRWSSWKALATAVTVMQCAEAPPRFHVLPSKSVEPCGTHVNSARFSPIQPVRFWKVQFWLMWKALHILHILSLHVWQRLNPCVNPASSSSMPHQKVTFQPPGIFVEVHVLLI